jgi:hypothetical protein
MIRCVVHDKTEDGTEQNTGQSAKHKATSTGEDQALLVRGDALLVLDLLLDVLN